MKIRALLCILLALAIMLFASCNKNDGTANSGGESSSESSKETSSVESSSIEEESSDESSSDESSSVEEESSSIEEESSSVETGSDESSSEENEPVIRPGPEVKDATITLFENGESEYTIVYSQDSVATEIFVMDFVSYVKSTYGIDIPYKPVFDNEDIGEKEIVIGFPRTSSFYASYKMGKKNDFIMDVYGDDLYICATNEGLYSYAFRLLKDIYLPEVGEAFVFSPDDEFVYSDSEYSDLTYTKYISASAGKNYDQALLSELYYNMSYTSSDGTILKYRLYIPYTYSELSSHPVLLFLHGAGERGTNNLSQMYHVVPDLMNHYNSDIENSIIICPQCPNQPNQWVDTPWASGNYSINTVAESNELKAVVELLGKFKNDFASDSDRFYVMGVSMGGFGTWDLIMRHTELFAAAVPICGGADVSMAEALKNFPIYTAHASNDNVVPYSGTNAMVQAIRNAGGTSIIFKCHADGSLSSGGHSIWSEIAKSNEMVEWLYNQSK